MNKKLRLLTTIVALVFIGGVIYYQYDDPNVEVNSNVIKEEIKEVVLPEKRLFGLSVDSFAVEKRTVKEGESFGNILLAYGVSYPIIHEIANNYKDVFDVRLLQSGKPYTVFSRAEDSAQVAKYFVYESSPVRYYVFGLGDNEGVKVYKGEKEVTVRRKEISGKIESSLYLALQEHGGSASLAMALADIYAWSLDFFRIQKGDYFKVFYEEKFIDDTISVGVGKILAADFNHQGRSYYSFYYENGEDYHDYFDERGNTLRRAFLKAPLNFFRISSRYSKSRFHPVLKRRKAHLGTDYAAPRGTPIMATADGEIIAASRTRGNGNYVKIRHNSTYTTQYLHMSRFAKSAKVGRRVKQGDVIGYVGSTGLATGPHVCYRFWKNGKQVDPYKQDLPEADPIKEEFRKDYMQYMREWKGHLDMIKIQEKKAPSIYVASAG